MKLAWGLVGLWLVGAMALAQPEKIVATVNGENVTESQFLNLLQARYGERVLKDLSANLAIRQAAKAAGAVVTDDELKRRFESTQASIDSRAIVTGETFAMWLAKQGMTPEAFLGGLYDQMLLEKMVEKQVSVTDEDVAKCYEANKTKVGEPAQMRVAHIAVKTQKEAEELRSQIAGGKITWEDAAKKHSLDPQTRENNGDMGFLVAGESEFQQVAFSLRTQGEMSQPVQSPMGWHLIKRIGFKAARTPPFEEVSESLRAMLERQMLLSLTLAKRNDILKAAKIEYKVDFKPEGSPAPAAPTPAPTQ